MAVVKLSRSLHGQFQGQAFQEISVLVNVKHKGVDDFNLIQIPAEGNFQEIVRDNAWWNNFQLSQDSCDHYIISKSTHEECAQITSQKPYHLRCSISWM